MGREPGGDRRRGRDFRIASSTGHSVRGRGFGGVGRASRSITPEPIGRSAPATRSESEVDGRARRHISPIDDRPHGHTGSAERRAADGGGRTTTGRGRTARRDAGVRRLRNRPGDRGRPVQLAAPGTGPPGAGSRVPGRRRRSPLRGCACPIRSRTSRPSGESRAASSRRIRPGLIRTRPRRRVKLAAWVPLPAPGGPSSISCTGSRLIAGGRRPGGRANEPPSPCR